MHRSNANQTRRFVTIPVLRLCRPYPVSLENVLFYTEDELANIKLINYGLSRKHIKSERQRETEGELSALYAVPPEAFRGAFSAQGDIWSVGVIAYTMLAGHQPFHGQ